MSKLLQRARVKRENAEYSYRNINRDDAYLDDCCFNLQQCIKLALKYAVELHGGRYVKNHDIRAQLNELARLGVSVPNAEALRQNAATINDWEASSRYKDNFIALLEDVDTARACADALLDFLKDKALPQPLEPVQPFPEGGLEQEDGEWLDR